MSVNRRVAGALLALIILGTGGTALAAPIIGTLDFLVINPFMNAAGTFVSADDALAIELRPLLTSRPSRTTPSFGAFTLDASNPVGTFGISNAAYGTFVPDSALISPAAN